LVEKSKVSTTTFSIKTNNRKSVLMGERKDYAENSTIHTAVFLIHVVVVVVVAMKMNYFM